MYDNDYRLANHTPKHRAPAPRTARAAAKKSEPSNPTKPLPQVGSSEWQQDQAEEARNEQRINRIVNGICRC
jgi:hypothetical protein